MKVSGEGGRGEAWSGAWGPQREAGLGAEAGVSGVPGSRMTEVRFWGLCFALGSQDCRGSPLLHTGLGAGFGVSFWKGLPLVQCQPLDWSHLEDGARKSHLGPCTAVGGPMRPPSAGWGGGVRDAELWVQSIWADAGSGRFGRARCVLKDERGSPAGHPWVPARA